MKRLCTTSAIAVVFISSATAGETPHFGYSGEHGPDYWSSLSPSFAACSAGRNQTPIDIAATVDAPLPRLAFNYASLAQDFVNNGHAVQANYGIGSTLSADYPPGASGASILDGEGSFELKQFHFHAPSEHLWRGVTAAAEIHFVHADAQGNLAVVGVGVQSGPENAAIARLFERMPVVKGQKHPLEGFNASALLPQEHDYYYYTGSLTTPPCSEGVRWIVMKQSVTMSDAQIDALRKAIGSANNRPVQPLNGRAVLE